MIHPLVYYTDRSCKSSGNRDAVLCKNSESQLIDHLGDSVIDLGVDMIRSSGEHDAVHSALLHLIDHTRAFGSDIFLKSSVFLGAFINSSLSFCQSYALILEDFRELLRYFIKIIKGHERIHEVDILLFNVLDIILDYFRIGTNDRTIVVIARILILDHLIRNIGIEDILDPAAYKILDMTVCQLGRIAYRLRRDRLHSLLIDSM